ncbi:MAG: DUF2000 family protein [Acidimicrobiales bacterium]
MTSSKPVNRALAVSTRVKIALAVRSDLEVWQKLNVAAFLPSGFGTADPSLTGDAYADGDGCSYPPMLAHPVRVFTGDSSAPAGASNEHSTEVSS